MSIGRSIVETALKLQTAYPRAPALEILDQALEGHRGSSPDFESIDPVTGRRPHPAYHDDTDPGTPFADLLRRAFAPMLDPRELLLLSMDTADVALCSRRSKAADAWQEVIEKFATRYDLWTL